MHITSISFNLPLSEHKIPLFKQAILGIEGIKQELYNNKKETKGGKETNLLRYPLIQFRELDGYASIWAINEGAKRLELDLKKKKLLTFFWEGRERSFQLIRHFTNASEEAQYTSATKFICYRISNYLPFSNQVSGSNTKSTADEYKNAKNIYEKIKITERVLISHLVLFSYAAGWKLKPRQVLKARVVDIKAIAHGIYKKTDPARTKHYLKLDLVVELNALLPDGIALGNQTSLGYGVLHAPEDE
jgi:hypothetical protein